MRHRAIYGLVVLAGGLASCQRSGAPAPVATGGAPSAVGPSEQHAGAVIEILNHQELEFEPGIKMTVWDLRASRVGELAARLLVIKDGKSEVAQEAIYKWDKWPESKPEAVWHLYYLLQNGEPFGAKHKRLPAITLKFDDAAPSNLAGKHLNRLVEGEFRLQHSEARKDSTIDSSRPDLVYFGFYDPAKGDSSVNIRPTVEAIVEATKGGRTAVAIVVEWKPIAERR